MFQYLSTWKSRLLFLIPLLLGLMAALFLKGCSLGGDRLMSMRVGTHRWPGYDIAFYAQESGLFAKRGLDVELINFDVNQDQARSLIRGDLDAAFLPLWEIMQIASGANTPVYMMVVNISSGSDGIVARPGIESVKQLKGKTIAAKFGTASHLILLEALKLHGLKPEEITIKDISNQVAAEEIKEEKVDAAAIWEPILSETAQGIDGTIIFTTADVDSLLIDGLATRSSYLESNREQLIQFILAWFDLMQKVEQKPDEVFQFVGELFGQTKESFSQDYSGLKKGDIAMNRRMFANKRLQEASGDIVKLLREDPRHNRTIRENVEIDGTLVDEAISIWEKEQQL